MVFLLTGCQVIAAKVQTTADLLTVNSITAADVMETRSRQVSTRRLSHDLNSETSLTEVLGFMTV